MTHEPFERVRQTLVRTFFGSASQPTSGPPARPIEPAPVDAADTVERVKPAVLQVRTRAGAGTGMVVADGRLILTNRHVVGAFPWVAASWSDGTLRAVPVIFSDRKLDLAVLAVNPAAAESLRLEDRLPRPGTHVLAVGHPLGYSHTVTAGIISGIGRVLEWAPGVEYLQTDVAINPGNSGGPLLTMAGAVVGMNTAVRTDAQGIGFALPASYLRAAVDTVTPWDTASRQYCPPCGQSAVDAKYCPVCGAGLERHELDPDFLGQFTSAT